MASAKVTEVLKHIQASQKTADIYIPSLKKDVKFKCLTAGQQEKFIQALVDNPGIQTKFILTLIEIFKENCLDKAAVNNFTLIDRYAIALGLRHASMGAKVRTEVENEPGIVYEIDLNETLSKIREKVKCPQLEPITVGDIKIDLQYPTISLEQANEKFFKRDETALDNSAEGLRSILSTAFIGDALMFIKTLTFTREEGEPIVLDFNGITLQDKLEIVRKLPNEVYEKLLEPMASVKRQIETILLSVGTSENDAKVKRTILIAFDPSLFVASS